jgi:hypothetical protein
MSDDGNGSGVKFSHVLLVICLIGIVFAGTTVGKWAKIACEIGERFHRCPVSLANPGATGPRTPTATRDYLAEAKAAYLRAADDACRQWTSQGPVGEAPRDHNGFAAWLRKIISLRRSMMGAWASVPTPSAISIDITAIFNDAKDALGALIGAYNQFISNNTASYRQAVAAYQRINGYATQRARNYGLDACGYNWANLY